MRANWCIWVWELGCCVVGHVTHDPVTFWVCAAAWTVTAAAILYFGRK